MEIIMSKNINGETCIIRYPFRSIDKVALNKSNPVIVHYNTHVFGNHFSWIYYTTITLTQTFNEEIKIQCYNNIPKKEINAVQCAKLYVPVKTKIDPWMFQIQFILDNDHFVKLIFDII